MTCIGICCHISEFSPDRPRYYAASRRCVPVRKVGSASQPHLTPGCHHRSPAWSRGVKKKAQWKLTRKSEFGRRADLLLLLAALTGIDGAASGGLNMSDIGRLVALPKLTLELRNSSTASSTVRFGGVVICAKMVVNSVTDVLQTCCEAANHQCLYGIIPNGTNNSTDFRLRFYSVQHKTDSGVSAEEAITQPTPQRLGLTNPPTPRCRQSETPIHGGVMGPILEEKKGLVFVSPACYSTENLIPRGWFGGVAPTLLLHQEAGRQLRPNGQNKVAHNRARPMSWYSCTQVSAPSLAPCLMPRPCQEFGCLSMQLSRIILAN